MQAFPDQMRSKEQGSPEKGEGEGGVIDPETKSNFEESSRI